jgi:hypothetical protein
VPPRPTARRLATELASLVDAAAGTGVARRRSRPLALRAVALVAGLAFAALVVGRPWTDGTSAGPRTVVVTTAAPAPPRIETLPRCAATAGHLVDEEVCGFGASVDGGAVTVDGVRSVVGRDDDEVAVGDWDCDGVPEPALLRPSTGEVLVFGPADASGARAVARATRVGGALRLDLADGAPGCAALRILDSTGRAVPIEGMPDPIGS